MNKKVKKLFVSLLALLLAMGCFAEPITALADAPYKTPLWRKAQVHARIRDED